MQRMIGWITVLLIPLTPNPLWARGGGGCIAGGTLIATPKGVVAIEKLKPGDPVWSVADGNLKSAVVRALRVAQPEKFVEIYTSGTKLQVTPEHPVMVAPGEYRIAGLLQIGDPVFLALNGKLERATLQSLRRIKAERSAYNLLVSPGGTFISGGFVVHNKGCFLPDSPILKSNGEESRINALQPGDELLAFTQEGRLVRTTVREILRHEVDEYILLKTDRETLRVTAEHPFYVGPGTFKTVEALKEGDPIFAWDGQWLAPQTIISIQRIRERVRVFNLQTDHPNTFFANRIAVHNKGGCFPAGTKIATPNGPVAIESLASGDEVLAVKGDGLTVRAIVKNIFVGWNPVLRIDTSGGALAATEEHPVSLWEGGFQQAGELKRGDRIIRWKDGRLVAKKIRHAPSEGDRELVFNLQVGEPHTFIAEGIVVHNKGGSSRSSGSSSSRSSSRSSSSSGGGSSDWVGFLILGIWISVFMVIFIALLRGRGSRKSENLDFIYGRAKVAPKAGKTEKLLSFLSQQDLAVSPEELRKLAQSTFRKLQECWEKRDYGPMQSLLMPDLFAQHTAQLKGLAQNHEINKIENLQMERIDLVNLRYTNKLDQREFTALITASARDCYVDDRTGKFLRGDKTSARFQEFWTFQRAGEQWLLREIEQAGESDALKDENFVEMLTEDTIKGIYGEAAKKKGEAGPWLEKETLEKATRIERLLNFLVQTDKLWNRNQMLERARQVFLSVYLARESGDPVQVPAGDLFPGVVESLRTQIERWQRDGLKVEYRNLCVRKTELILIHNFSDQTKDEFTVRINAHAQRIILEKGRVTSEQEYVTPFDEYWTFGRLNNQWKLKEVLPPARGKKKLIKENVDEDSSPGQLQWYYGQTRAT